MTREEQVDWLCRLRADLNNGVIFTPWNKEFTEALTDILEQVPCEDCVSKQAVAEVLLKYAHSEVGKAFVEFLVGQINDLPPVNPQMPSISEDGTLTVNVEDGSKVSRVLVCGDNHFGGLYYPDQEPCDKCVYSTNEGCQYDDITETIPPFDDCISRQAVIDMTGLSEWFDSSDSYNEFVIALSELPPATSQPKMGHWINDVIQGEIDGQIVKAFICSECGAISVFRITDGKIVNGDLCPNCCAKMTESEE